MDAWVSYERKEIDLKQRIKISGFLTKSNQSVPLLKPLIAGYEKWIFYNKASIYGNPFDN